MDDKGKAWVEAQEEQLRVMKEHGDKLDFDILQVGGGGRGGAGQFS